VGTAPDDGTACPARPRLVVSVTASVDGRVTLNRTSRLLDEAAGKMWDSIHPGSADGMFAARRAEIERRYAPQVVLEGSGTFVADTDGPITGLPAPTSADIATLYDDFLPAEANCRWFAVVDGRGRIRWTHKGDSGRRLLVIVSHATPAPYLAHLRSEDVPYLVAGDGPVDLGDALRTMKSRLGATCVVSEAGGGLNGALLRSGLVDELHLMLLPSLVGGLGTPTIFDGVPLQLGQLPTRLRLLDARVTTDGIVSLHYEIDRQPVSGALPGDEKLV
jgi:2,5-diamino-6-(ribosylamino)-4(3H)-pyrimidinone 5'-phosphate reductase